MLFQNLPTVSSWVEIDIPFTNTDSTATNTTGCHSSWMETEITWCSAPRFKIQESPGGTTGWRWERVDLTWLQISCDVGERPGNNQSRLFRFPRGTQAQLFSTPTQLWKALQLNVGKADHRGQRLPRWILHNFNNVPQLYFNHEEWLVLVMLTLQMPDCCWMVLYLLPQRCEQISGKQIDSAHQQLNRPSLRSRQGSASVMDHFSYC